MLVGADKGFLGQVVGQVRIAHQAAGVPADRRLVVGVDCGERLVVALAGALDDCDIHGRGSSLRWFSAWLRTAYCLLRKHRLLALLALLVGAGACDYGTVVFTLALLRPPI